MHYMGSLIDNSAGMSIQLLAQRCYWFIDEFTLLCCKGFPSSLHGFKCIPLSLTEPPGFLLRPGILCTFCTTHRWTHWPHLGCQQVPVLCNGTGDTYAARLNGKCFHRLSPETRPVSAGFLRHTVSSAKTVVVRISLVEPSTKHFRVRANKPCTQPNVGLLNEWMLCHM